MNNTFVLPVAYDLVAVFLFALTGALIAVKRGYDPVGVIIIAIISGAGGGILRDAVFLNIQPALIRDWRYSAVLFVAIAAVFLARSALRTRPIALLIMATEALGIGLNAVYGTQRSLDIKASIYAAVIVGLINVVGGRLMRDTVMGKTRKTLIPSRMFGVAGCVAIATYLLLAEFFEADIKIAAWAAIVIAFLIRITAVRFDIKTRALVDYYDPSEKIVSTVTRRVNPYVSKIDSVTSFRKKKTVSPPNDSEEKDKGR